MFGCGRSACLTILYANVEMCCASNSYWRSTPPLARSYIEQRLKDAVIDEFESNGSFLYYTRRHVAECDAIAGYGHMIVADGVGRCWRVRQKVVGTALSVSIFQREPMSFLLSSLYTVRKGHVGGSEKSQGRRFD